MTLNSDKPIQSLDEAKKRVLCLQRKLHRWSQSDADKRFDDLFNLVCDRTTLAIAWERVSRNRGSRTAGVDGVSRWHIVNRQGADKWLEDLRVDLKARTYRPQRVREQAIPKAGGKMRYLGIPTVRDRVVQMALKLILEPIFETDFCPTSYGYRPARRAQDAITEITRYINPPSSYNYVVEGDIEGCFDNIDHGVLMQQVRNRIGDRKVLQLVKAFLRAGVMKESGQLAATLTGTPQGGIISPLLANIYLTVLDDRFEREWQHQTRYRGCTTYYRRRGYPTYRLVRYADDFVILVRGTRAQAERLRDQAAHLLRAELRMELSLEKSHITHVDDGFDFLGHHIRRVPWRGRQVAWTYPSKKSLEALTRKVRGWTTRSTTYLTLEQLLRHLNPMVRGWTNYFRYDAAKRTFAYVDHFVWWRVMRWLRKKHPKRNWRYLRKRYCGGKWDIRMGRITLFRPHLVKVERYRSRGQRILLPWMNPDDLGPVGAFARGPADETTYLETLQLRLAFD